MTSSSSSSTAIDETRLTALRQEFADFLNPTEALDSRIRALYRLKESNRNLYGALILLEAVDTTDSVLLQHEVVYNIGQFGFAETIPGLKRIIDNNTYDVVTRHEAIEALGAIGHDDGVLEYLMSIAKGDEVATEVEGHPQQPKYEAPIQESAILAVMRIEMKRNEGAKSVAPPEGCPFVSVDPSPAFHEKRSIQELAQCLMDVSGATSLWDRYRAMFSLRNIGTKEAAIVLGKSLREDKSSCLFRHEIAFVLGQMEHPASEPYLAEALMDEQEHAMVRHEAAEAIGALAEKHSWNLLERYANHPEGIVRDSCVVALDMHKYWSQYKKHDAE